MGNPYAALWWRNYAHWCYELQRRTPFRNSAPDIEYLLYFEDEGDLPVFHKYSEQGDLVPCDKQFERDKPVIPAKGVSLWGADDLADIILSLAESLNMEIKEACRRFAVIRLTEGKEDSRWQYHPVFGIYRHLD
jgi:CRISPR-associated endonuclease/helicase Cas3